MCKLVLRVFLATLTSFLFLLFSLTIYLYYVDTNIEFASKPWKSFDIKLPSPEKKLKVAFIVFGTRGDYQPIALIAKEFKKNGHSVLLTSRRRYTDFLTKRVGLNNEDILWVPDIDVSFETIGNKNRGSNFFVQAINFIQFFRREYARYIHLAMEDDRFNNVDLIVIHEPMLITGYLLSLKLRVPIMMLKYHHMFTSNNEYRSLSSAFDKNSPSILNWMEYHIYHTIAICACNSIWESFIETHNLPYKPLYKYLYGSMKYEIPSYFLYSTVLYPNISKHPDWWNYVGPAILPEQPISSKLVKFIDDCANNTIVYVGLGSLSLQEYYGEDAHHIRGTIFNTMSKLDYCVIYLNATFEIPPDSPPVMNPKWHFSHEVSHTTVFSKVHLVIHHGGAGTVQAASISGNPAIAIPIFEEQRYNSEAPQKFGISFTLENSELSEDTLQEAILKALQVTDCKEKSQRIKERILGTEFVYKDMIKWLNTK